MDPSPNVPARFPDWLRWSAISFLIFWFVVYWRYWGLANFLHLCDAAVILTCIGLWTNNMLLISSQAVGSLIIDFSWVLDVLWKISLNHHLVGGTEYFFDSAYPLWVRLLSLFHLALPVVLLWALYRHGYDLRAWALESAITLFLYSAARFTSPEANIGFAFTDPFFHHSWKPAPLHVAFTVLFLMLVVFLPTHLILRQVFPSPAVVKSR